MEHDLNLESRRSANIERTKPDRSKGSASVPVAQKPVLSNVSTPKEIYEAAKGKAAGSGKKD